MEEKTPTDETTVAPPSETPAAGDVPADAPAPVSTDAPTNGTVAIVGTPDSKLTFMHQVSQDTVYLMGLSFLVGVLFTVFILLIFEFMRRNASDTTVVK